MSSKDLTSVGPYFDDFNPDLNFLRIVFTPGRAVQARELTQVQTILQNQVAVFANHFFKNNSTILGARISTTTSKPGCKLYNFQVTNRTTGTVSSDPLTAIFPIASLVGRTFVNRDPLNGSSGTPTKRLTVTHSFEGPGANEITIYYAFSGVSPAADELFFDEVGSGGVAIKVKTAQFLSAAASCEPGIVYRNGHFVNVLSQEIIVDPGYESTGSHYAIGYRFDEDVVTESDGFHGNLLLDPANGSYNYAAPGAHRYRITPVLDYFDKADEPTTDPLFLDKFSSYVELKDNRIIRDQRDTQYAQILNLLARRTYDESGNYTVKDFSVVVKDHPSNDELLLAEVSPGKAYVLGYEISRIVSESVVLDKARDFQLINNNFAQAAEHLYFRVETSSLAALGPAGYPIVLRDISLRFGAPLQAFTVGANADGTSVARTTATTVGTCRAHSLVRVGSEWRLYLIDASPSLLANLSSVKSFRVPTGTPGTLEGLVLVSGVGTSESKSGRPVGSAFFSGALRDPLVYQINASTVTKSLALNETTFRQIVYKEGTASAGGAVTFTADVAGMIYNNTADAVPFFAYNNGGTWTQLSVVPGDIVLSGGGSSITITKVAAASQAVRVYLLADQTQAPWRQKIVSSVTETVSFVPNAASIANLSNEDGYRIVSVRQMNNVAPGVGTAPYVLPVADLAKLKFDTGARDAYYDFARVTGWASLVANYAVPANSTTFEITYEYFSHAGAPAAAYFCVNSYPFGASDLELIPTYVSSSGRRYELVNCLDFRVKLSEIQSKFPIIPGERARVDSEMYLGRIDKVVLNSTGEFVVAKGISSFTPESPNEVAGAMTLFQINLSPYTADRKKVRIKMFENKRYTMRDIGKIEKRVENLEVYAAMSQLEQSANNLSVVDAATGFDKFKNGIFSDPFRNHSFANKDDALYRVAVDPLVGGIRCPFSSVGFDLVPLAGSNTVQLWGNTATLVPLTTEILAANEYASSATNVNSLLFFVWNGAVALNPSIDTWFDTQFAPEILNEEGSFDIPDNVSTGVVWNDWQLNWTGTSYTNLSNPTFRPDGNISSVTATTTYTNTAQTETRTGSNSNWIPTTTVNVDDRLINTAQIPYMRSIGVAVKASGMRQGTPIKGFLDGVEMTLVPDAVQWTETGTGRPQVDSDGAFEGKFTIPAGLITTGTKAFYLVDDDNTSSATTNFTSSGILNTRQRTITTVRGVEEVRTVVSETRNLDEPTTVENRVTNTIWFDPIAQSFLIDSAGGAFLSSIEVFFKTRPLPTDGIDYQPITLYIVEMENGYPTQKVVPFSVTTKHPSTVGANDVTPALGSTVFTFSDPVYLEEGTEYAFILFSNSRKYEAWISTLGEQDIFSYVPGGGTVIVPVERSIGIESTTALNEFRTQKFVTSDGQVTTRQIDNSSFLPRVDPNSAFRGSNSPGRGIAEQPYLGSLFKSQNASTWEAFSASDISFRIRKYIFPINTDQVLTLRDNKINAVGTAIYGTGTGQVNDHQVSTAMLNIGDMRLPSTQIAYTFDFHQGTTASNLRPVTNRENVFLGQEYLLDNNVNSASRNNFTSVATLRSVNSNLSPVIDIQQCRLIGVKNLAIFDVNTSKYDAGWYVSKTISLLNPSDDLRVLIDAKIPSGAEVNVYYRTTEESRSYANILAGLLGSLDSTQRQATAGPLVGRNCRLIYRASAGAEVGNPHPTSPTANNPAFTQPAVRCTVSDFLSDSILGGGVVSQIFVRAVNDRTKFLAPAGLIDRLLLVTEETALDIAANGGATPTVPNWSNAVNYAAAASTKFVIWNNRLWRLNTTLYPSSTDVTAIEPSVGGVAWEQVSFADVGSALNLENGARDWRPMELTDEINPNVNTANQFVEYNFEPVDAPEEFNQFSIAIEMISPDPANVPVCRNLRSIAVI